MCSVLCCVELKAESFCDTSSLLGSQKVFFWGVLVGVVLLVIFTEFYMGFCT